MSSFKGSRRIILQPNDNGLGFDFEITVCSSLTSNDGFIPYGNNVVSVDVQAETEDGTSCTTALIVDGTGTVVANVITIRLQYPTEFGPGRYFIRFICTLDDVNSSTIEADFTRVFATNEGF